jgi:hypothetical protein
VKHSIYLGCATLPKDAGELIQAYLGIGGYKVHDWRNHEDFGAKPGGYCDEFDAIDLASYE